MFEGSLEAQLLYAVGSSFELQRKLFPEQKIFNHDSSYISNENEKNRDCHLYKKNLFKYQMLAKFEKSQDLTYQH